MKKEIIMIVIGFLGFLILGIGSTIYNQHQASKDFITRTALAYVDEYRAGLK